MLYEVIPRGRTGGRVRGRRSGGKRAPAVGEIRVSDLFVFEEIFFVFVLESLLFRLFLGGKEFGRMIQFSQDFLIQSYNFV